METLEEFSLNYSNFGSQQLDFLNGAKWQQENFIISSKIDDVIELIETNGNSINDKNLTINDIYELCKKLQHLQIKQKSVADVFKQGAKWQQERSYSEEEVLHILDTFWDRLDVWYNEGVNTEFTLKEWFNKCELKKK